MMSMAFSAIRAIVQCMSCLVNLPIVLPLPFALAFGGEGVFAYGVCRLTFLPSNFVDGDAKPSRPIEVSRRLAPYSVSRELCLIPAKMLLIQTLSRWANFTGTCEELA